MRKQLLKAGAGFLEWRSLTRLRRNQALWALIQNYRERTRFRGCSFSDYEALYAYVRRANPSEILECGTGISTIVIAQALLENAEKDGSPGHLTSMEDVARWFEDAKQSLPRHFRGIVDLICSPTVETGYGIWRGLRYRDVPDRSYDFVFTDGPSAICGDGTRAVDFDYLHILREANRPVFGSVLI